ncbi:hypothetical protein CTEN210_02859 [Chaetoceros tenuissimus]|uniref:Leucine-rich repeat domain-containing protein n=1 Tax=Chaetoceros tenuissimus TaxID=426638 RepID=A0AAD3H101_9STRA|nr:hypothetical protein CTEN210_02859 [Chaetoceros tenuissimus]
MRVATVDGLVTLFYDGSKELYNEDLHEEWWKEYYNYTADAEDFWERWNLSDECKRYWKERQTWQQVIVMEGVTVIPRHTFAKCKKIKRVIFTNTVVRIKEWAFVGCKCLTYIKWSINIEVIEDGAFCNCGFTSVFIPPTCREIGEGAFRDNEDLAIFHVHPNILLGDFLLSETRLLKESRFELDGWGNYEGQTDEVHNWIKHINNDEKYSLHRACCSFQPLKEVLMTIIKAKGIGAFNIKNEAGITPSRYLKENPFADIKEMDIVRDYIATMMGEYNN